MTKKNKSQKAAMVKKEEHVEKCSHGFVLGDTPCEQCEKDEKNLSKNISKSLISFQKKIKTMKSQGWTAFMWPKTQIIRFKNSNRKDSFYCPITAACLFETGKSYGAIKFVEAARKINLLVGVRQIVDAADCSEGSLLDENSKSFRKFMMNEFNLYPKKEIEEVAAEETINEG